MVDDFRIFGYAQAYESAEDSIKKQVESIEAKAESLGRELQAEWAELQGEWAGCIKEKSLDSAVPFDERPKLKKLIEELKPNDYLIVRHLDKLHRNGKYIRQCLEILTHSLEVKVVVLDFGGHEITIDNMVGRVITTSMEIQAVTESHRISMARRAGQRRAKQRGEMIHRARTFGWTTIMGANKNGTPCFVRLEPCEEERQQIRRIHQSRTKGKTFQSIAEEFHNLKTANRAPWVTRGSQKRKNKYGTTRIRLVYHLYEAMGEEMFVLGREWPTK